MTPSGTRRFLVVGTGAAALHATLTYALIRSGFDASVSAAGAYGVAIAVAYLAHKNWAFQSRSAHRRTLPRYLLAQSINATVAAVVARLAAATGAADAVIAAVSTVMASASAYWLSSRWVFVRAS
jgi:putative flippase GtrA